MADCTNLSDNMLDNCVNPICSDLNTENSNHHSSTFETEKLSKDLMCKIDKDVHLKNDCYPPKNCQLSHSHSAEVEEEINDQLQKTNSSSFKEKFAHQYHEKLELSKQSSKIIDSFANLNDLKPTISINSTAIDFNVDNQSNTYSDKVQNNACTSKPQINSDELKSVSQVELSSNEQLNDIVELISDEYKSESNKNGAGDVDSMLIDQETLNLDENSTQLRFSCSTQKNTYSSNVLTDHLFAETTVAQSPNDCNSDFFPKLTCHLPTSTDEESDKESNVSAENSDFICELASSTALSALEESSLDSGIASLDDAENTDIKQNSFLTKISTTKTAPTSILGKRQSCTNSEPSSSVPCKRKKLENSKSKVVFSGVTVYYFPRKQSFITVPSQGGSTLGMSLQHSYTKQMSLNQHKRSIARHRKKTIEEQKKQLKLSAKLKQLKQDNPEMDTSQLMSMIVEDDEESQESSEDEEHEDNQDDVSTDDDFDDDNYFLQPIPAKKRRLLLRMAGVQKIDLDEKFSNKATRESREVCGCGCVRFCFPSSCQCALAGIPCQVDRESFPCGCLATGCCNPNGRVEFDAERVKRHYTKTMKKLRLQETGLLPRDELTELPQPPKSPYVSPPEQCEDYDAPYADSGPSSVQQLHESNIEGVQSSYENNLQFSADRSFSSSNSPELDVWSMGYSTQPSTNYYSFATDFATGETSIVNTFEDLSQNNGTSFFGSSTLCDVNSIVDDVTSTNENLTNIDHLQPPQSSAAYESPCRDFSFAESHLCSPCETKPPSSVLGQVAQFGYRQTHKLDPIASFFSSNGRRPSEEYSVLSLDLPDARNDEIAVSSPISSPNCKQSCSFESLLCAEEASPSRSRSSSLSECNHDSVVKA